MEIKSLTANAYTIENELRWFSRVVKARFENYFSNEQGWLDISTLPAPSIHPDESPYARLVNHYEMGIEERFLLILTLAPQIKPSSLDLLHTENPVTKKRYAEFGGVLSPDHSGLTPTAQTALFLIAGANIEYNIQLQSLFRQDYFFLKHGILQAASGEGKPQCSQDFILKLSPEYLTLLTSGEQHKPDYSTHFPAKRIETPLDWEDLVLDHSVREEIEDLVTWIEHGSSILQEWNLQRQVKQGYRSLFYGPPGTGKTLTACLIGKSINLDIYRVDLSMVVSKYIGETEKNLSKVFDQAEHKQWILFFDEADALFGQRTQTSSSNDRYANQEVAYLLQRIEDFPGIVILASNLKGNIDEAFARRFQSMIYFPVPNEEERLILWKKAFAPPLVLDSEIDLTNIARDHVITGGAIINVLRHCAIRAKQRNSETVFLQDIEQGIRKEKAKKGEFKFRYTISFLPQGGLLKSIKLIF